MHLIGRPSGVSQTVRKGSLRSLHQARLGALKRKVDSQTNSHETGIENNQHSHFVDDIPSTIGPPDRASLIRLACVGASRPSRAYRSGTTASVSCEISHILPAAGSSTRTMIRLAVLPSTVMTPALTWPGESPV